MTDTPKLDQHSPFGTCSVMLLAKIVEFNPLPVNPGAKRGQLPVEYWATFRDQDCVWARVLTT